MPRRHSPEPTLVRSFLLVVLAVAASCPVVLAAQTDKRDPSELFRKAVMLHQSGDVIGAIQYYQETLELVPDNVEVRSNLGAALAKLGRYDDAIEQYLKVLALKPDFSEVRFNLGLAYYKGGRIPEAADAFRTVIKADPKQRAATLLLADCLGQMGKVKEVVDLLGPLESSFSDDRLFEYLFGSALIAQNEVERGQAIIDRLLRDGESAEAHLLMGAQYLNSGETLKAQPEIEKALQLNPNLPMAHALYGKVLQQNRDHDAAAREFAEELKRNPNDFDSNLQLGLLRREENRLDEAMTYLKRARRLRPADPSVAWAIGRVNLAANRLDDARAELEKVVSEVPAFQPAHVVLATVFYRLGLRDKGDGQRAIVEKLKAQAKEEQEQAQKAIGPTSFRGEDESSPEPQ